MKEKKVIVIDTSGIKGAKYDNKKLMEKILCEGLCEWRELYVLARVSDI